MAALPFPTFDVGLLEVVGTVLVDMDDPGRGLSTGLPAPVNAPGGAATLVPPASGLAVVPTLVSLEKDSSPSDVPDIERWKPMLVFGLDGGAVFNLFRTSVRCDRLEVSCSVEEMGGVGSGLGDERSADCGRSDVCGGSV